MLLYVQCCPFFPDKRFAVGKYVSVSLSIRPLLATSIIFSVEDDVNGDFVSLEMDEGVVSIQSMG